VSTADDRVGVGLAVVNAIAEAHGWSATVSEGSEGGARFWFAFDRAR
jgi:signal transduction histidine kinase